MSKGDPMNSMLKTSCAVAAAAAASASLAHAGPCTTLAAALAAAPTFEAYRVAPSTIVRPAPVVFGGNKDARRFRTVLREAAKAGPNFAGRYTVAGWGCGTACLDWGVIDAATGKVAFDARIRPLENLSSDWDLYKQASAFYEARGGNREAFDQILFRRDSALLVTLGAPAEDESRDGIAYWRWHGGRFTRVHFVPARSLCRAG
jgi:hypothetical protein